MRAKPVTAAMALAAALLLAVGCTAAPPAGPSPSSSHGDHSPSGDGEVPTTFPTQQRQPFAAPPELSSQNGVLETTFTAEPTTFDVAGAQIRGYAFQGGFIGPTLRVKPGDTLKVHIRNRLAEPTNLHSHGMFVSPVGDSDNVLRVMKADTDNDFVLNLPDDVDPGSYWYHTHLHGRVEEQVFAGLSGLLVVEGLKEQMPAEYRSIPDHVMNLKDLQVKDGAIKLDNIDSNAPTTRTVNGQVDPVVSVRTNETQLLRLANIGADIWYRLKLGGSQFRVIAEDANPVSEVWTADELVLPPGKRYDVLVRWPAVGSHHLETLEFSTGPDGDNYPKRRLATFNVAGEAVPDQAWPTSLGPPSPLADEKVDRTRTLVFSEDPKSGKFFIDGREFDATRVNVIAKLGTTEEWTIKNTSKELHPFHIHVNDFEVMEINGQPYDARSRQDIIPLPVGGEVRIRMKFVRFTGATVFHCHILAHEDNGMMGIIDISRDGKLSPETQKALKDMNDAMGHHSSGSSHSGSAHHN